MRKIFQAMMIAAAILLPVDAEAQLGTIVNVKSFGATGDGTHDDTSAIQTAVNSLTHGGTVWFPVGNYMISSTITIGNGGASAVSTKNGIVLMGEGLPTFPGWAAMSSAPPTSLTFSGGSGAIIGIAGPIQGWGVQNLLLNGSDKAWGIYVQSGQYGDCRNLAIVNVIKGIYSTTVNNFMSTGPTDTIHGGATDSIHNAYKNIKILTSDTSGASGITLTGYEEASPSTYIPNSNTDYNDFENIYITHKGTSMQYGIYLRLSDSNQFRNVHFNGGAAGSGAMVFLDYGSPQPGWPASNAFWGVDPGNGRDAPSWVNNGTPSAGAGVNYVYGLVTTNGAQPVSLPNLSFR